MEQITTTLTYLGITPQQIVPMLLVGGVAAYILWRNYFKDLKEEVIDLHHATKEVQRYLEADGTFSPQHSLAQKPIFDKYGTHNSPMQPSADGRRLLKESGFNAMYKSMRPQIFKKMDRMKPRTPYDYEAAASKALTLLADDPCMDRLKDYAVNHPDEPLELIFGVASWVIRDDYEAYRGV